jgi:hypothetical protein
MWLIWASLVGALAVYGLIPVFVPLPAEPSSAPQTPLTMALAIVAVGTAVASIAVRRVALVGPIHRGELDPSTESGVARFFAISLVSWALSESIGLYGLVLFFLFRVSGPLYLFLAVAFVLLLYHAPRGDRPMSRSSVEDLARPGVKIG